jgi:hypothetical protein
VRARLLAVVVAAAMAVVLPACGEREEFLEEVRAAVRRTERLPARFVYDVRTPEKSAQVKGIIEDDFRFKARVTINQADAYDEVVSDDTLALRFITPERLNPLVDRDRVDSADLRTDFEGVTVLDALRARYWVVDARGAPSVTASNTADDELGEDYALDAISALDYVEKAATEALSVERFDPEDLSPAYASSEDIFPRPERGSGVERYDLRRPDLPPPARQLGSGDAVLPQTKHFRKMAVYIKDGVVIQVREAIELRGKALDDFVRYLRTFLEEADAPAAVREEYDRSVRQTPRDELPTLLFNVINEGLRQFGVDQIPFRFMNLDLRDIGGDISVDLPDGEVVRGDLGVLTISRRVEAADEGATSGGGTPAPPTGG